MSREWVVLQQMDTRTLNCEDHQERHCYRHKLLSADSLDENCLSGLLFISFTMRRYVMNNKI